MRFVYTLILYCLTPLVLLRLAYRGTKAPAYWRRWPERFGFFAARLERPCLWVHAVSVGEVQAALPVIKALLEKHEDRPVVVTTTTPTGLEQVKSSLGDAVIYGHLPYDLPGAINRFLTRVRPSIAVIMETELWPNLFYQCQRRRVPIVVANARLSARSARGYQRFTSLTRETLSRISYLGVQAEPDAQRFVALGMGAQRIQVTGNVKFDVQLPVELAANGARLRSEWGEGRPVWIAASTHAGEDEHVLDALRSVKADVPNVLLVLVPRHPERFEDVAQLCRRRGYEVARRSASQCPSSNTAVYLGDTMGELLLLFSASDVAFVGGSLVATGGHNMLEPAAVGIPSVTGPHTFNFADITRLLVEAGAVRQVQDSKGLADAITQLLTHPDLRQQAGQRGQEIITKNKGATARIVAQIDRLLGLSTSEIR